MVVLDQEEIQEVQEAAVEQQAVVVVVQLLEAPEYKLFSLTKLLVMQFTEVLPVVQIHKLLRIPDRGVAVH